MKGLFAVVMWLVIAVLGEGTSLAAPNPTVGNGTADELRSSVLSLDKVIRNTIKTISAHSATSLLTPQETKELKEFALYLQTRVVIYCEQLASQFPEQSMHGLPCPSFQMPLGSNLTLPPPAATDEEELDNLEQQLAESMGAFDEMLLAEETRIAGHRPKVSGRDIPDTGGHGQLQGSVQQEKQAGGSDGERSRHSGTVEAASGQDDTSVGAGSGQGQPPSVSHDGTQGKLVIDDDIVARQLREAAEKEQDPQLKEKLWQEYWKYKGKKM